MIGRANQATAGKPSLRVCGGVAIVFAVFLIQVVLIVALIQVLVIFFFIVRVLFRQEVDCPPPTPGRVGNDEFRR
jgi:hypothetical protein